jgi:hypothetical protein
MNNKSTWSSTEYSSVLTDEVVVQYYGLSGRLKLGVHRINDKISSLYIKYHDLGKRKLMWTIWEQSKSNYQSYEEFKANFDPKTKIIKHICKEIKHDISNEIRNLLQRDDTFKTKRIDPTRIRRLDNTSTQSRLNHFNSNWNRAVPIKDLYKR